MAQTDTPGPPGAPAATTQLCYASLRRQILAGERSGGTWLRESALAADMGFSRTPVREALRMLSAEGLVELVRNRGARVTSWTGADIDESYQLRALLEGHGAELAAVRASGSELAAMSDAEDSYELALRSGATAGAAASCNLDFHQAVLRASGSARLVALVASISSATLVARALQRYEEDDRRRSILQHRDVITAIEHRDTNLAGAAMRSHILAARYTAMQVAAASPAE